MIFKKLLILKFTFLLPLTAVAQHFVTNSIKEIDFVPKHLKAKNEIKFFNNTKDIDSIHYTVKECYPLKRNSDGIYNEDRSREGSVPYISDLSLRSQKDMEGLGIKIEMQLNGIYIETPNINAKRGVGLTFAFAENCTKLIPVGFISSKDQNYLGFKISKGDMVSPKYWRLDGDLGVYLGEIAEDGYFGPWEKSEQKNLMKDLKNFEKAQAQYTAFKRMCIKVRRVSSEKKGFYIYNNKKIPLSQGNPKIWLAKSKYIGHRLCSEQPNAIIACYGTSKLDPYYTRQIFGLDPKDPEESQETYQNMIKKAEEKGKKCDMAVAKYEKETGKKVKVSPFLPEEMKSKFAE